MRDIVIVPTYDRPEFLMVCLEHIAAAQGGKEKEIWICEDHHKGVRRSGDVDMETFAVFDHFVRVFPNIFFYPIEEHPYYGNSHNLVEALKRAAFDSTRYVYIVEDDVMVTPDFFRWNEAAQEAFTPHVTCAGRINRSLNFEMNGREAIDESCKDLCACVRSIRAYISWASCYRWSSLAWLGDYNPNPADWKAGFEQDIYIQTRIRECRETSIWPYVPRAYHMGWVSYHRNTGLAPNGTFDEKVAFVKKAISNKEVLSRVALAQEMDPFPTQTFCYDEKALYLKADYRK